jgi:hypothetical protein
MIMAGKGCDSLACTVSQDHSRCRCSCTYRSTDPPTTSRYTRLATRRGAPASRGHANDFISVDALNHPIGQFKVKDSLRQHRKAIIKPTTMSSPESSIVPQAIVRSKAPKAGGSRVRYRACLLCSFIQTSPEWKANGCPNCDDILDVSEDLDEDVAERD